MKKKGFRYDIILIVSFLSVSLVGVGLLWGFRREGKHVKVEIDGVRTAVYSLDKNGEYILNGGTNVLVIEDGAAYIRDADCPDKTCVKKGKLRYVGQSSVCLPNRLAVTVIGESAGGVDLVS